MKFKRAMVLVSNDPKSIEKGAGEVYDKLAEEIRKLNLDEEISLSKVTDIGRNDASPLVIVYPLSLIHI